MALLPTTVFPNGTGRPWCRMCPRCRWCRSWRCRSPAGRAADNLKLFPQVVCPEVFPEKRFWLGLPESNLAMATGHLVALVEALRVDMANVVAKCAHLHDDPLSPSCTFKGWRTPAVDGGLLLQQGRVELGGGETKPAVASQSPLSTTLQRPALPQAPGALSSWALRLPPNKVQASVRRYSCPPPGKPGWHPFQAFVRCANYCHRALKQQRKGHSTLAAAAELGPFTLSMSS